MCGTQAQLTEQKWEWSFVKTTQLKLQSNAIWKYLAYLIQTSRNEWNDFWFRSQAPHQMRLFRATAGAVMFLSAFARTFDLQFFFGENGMLHQAMQGEIIDMRFRHSLFEL